MERPTGVTILGVLAFIGAALLAMAAAGMLLVGGALLARMGARPLGVIGGLGAGFIAVVIVALAVLYAFIGNGLLKLQNWARVATIVLTGLGAAFNGIALLALLMHLRPFLFFREAVFVGIDVWIVVYLLQPQVKQAFGATGL